MIDNVRFQEKFVQQLMQNGSSRPQLGGQDIRHVPHSFRGLDILFFKRSRPDHEEYLEWFRSWTQTHGRNVESRVQSLTHHRQRADPESNMTPPNLTSDAHDAEAVDPSNYHEYETPPWVCSVSFDEGSVGDISRATILIQRPTMEEALQISRWVETIGEKIETGTFLFPP